MSDFRAYLRVDAVMRVRPGTEPDAVSVAYAALKRAAGAKPLGVGEGEGGAKGVGSWIFFEDEADSEHQARMLQRRLIEVLLDEGWEGCVTLAREWDERREPKLILRSSTPRPKV